MTANLNTLNSKINMRSDTFRINQSAMLPLVENLKSLSARLALGGSQKSRDKHTSRGKLLVRERINALIDVGSAFLEIGQLAGLNVYDDDVP